MTSQITAVRAADRFTALLEQWWREVSTDDPDERLHPSLRELSELVNSLPYDRRVHTLGHVMTIFESNLFEEGPVVDALCSWPGGDADEFLSRITTVAARSAQQLRRSHPERALAYRNYLRALGSEDLISEELSDGEPGDQAPPTPTQP